MLCCCVTQKPGKWKGDGIVGNPAVQGITSLVVSVLFFSRPLNS